MALKPVPIRRVRHGWTAWSSDLDARLVFSGFVINQSGIFMEVVSPERIRSIGNGIVDVDGGGVAVKHPRGETW